MDDKLKMTKDEWDQFTDALYERVMANDLAGMKALEAPMRKRAKAAGYKNIPSFVAACRDDEWRRKDKLILMTREEIAQFINEICERKEVNDQDGMNAMCAAVTARMKAAGHDDLTEYLKVCMREEEEE